MERPWVRRLFFDSTDEEFLVAKTREGSIFLVSTQDAIISRGIFGERNSWDFDLLVKVLALLPSEKNFSTLIDVGANVGSIGISAAKSDLFANVLMIEPDPHNFKLLRCNSILSQVEDRVELINVALGDGSSESLYFELSGNNYGDHRVRADKLIDTSKVLTAGMGGIGVGKGEHTEQFDESKRKVINVPVQTLDSLITQSLQKNPNEPANGGVLLFMDTQGYEGHILRGSSSFLKRSRGAIVAEFWPYGLARAGSGFYYFRDALLNSNFTKFIDLNRPAEILDVTPANLDKMHSDYSQDGRHTDLLVF